MATYGYSTPYMGQRQPTLPPGYMEAATAPGRNLAAGIAQLGAGIGQAIQRYQTNKAENEAATQTFETLSGMAQQALASDPSYQALQNYYETGQLPQGVTEADLQRFSKKAEADRSMLNRMVGLGEKFGDMSVAKKKAAIGDMAMVLQQYQQRGESEMKREAGQLALDKARREAETQKQLDVLMRQAGNLPTTQTVNIPEQYQVPIPPPVSGARPSVQAPAPQMTVEDIAKQRISLQDQISALESNAQKNELQVRLKEQELKQIGDQLSAPQAPYSSALGASLAGSGTGIRFPSSPSTTSRLEREIAQEEFRRQAVEAGKINADLMAQATADRAKAQALRAQMEGIGRPQVQQPQEKPKQITPQFETRTRMVPTQQAVPYDELRRNLAQFATERGMNAEAFGAIDKILEAAGRQKPMRVESQQLPGGAMVIRADNKIEILPPAKPVEGKDLTESQALSAGFAARMAYNNKVIDDTIKSGYTPKELTEFGWMPDRFKTQSRKSYESAKSNWIAAQLRKESGAAIGPMEYEQADIQYFPQPGDSKDVIQQKAELRKVAERTMKAAVGRNSDFYIQQILGGAQEAQFPQGPGTYRLVRGKEIQPIQ